MIVVTVRHVVIPALLLPGEGGGGDGDGGGGGGGWEGWGGSASVAHCLFQTQLAGE